MWWTMLALAAPPEGVDPDDIGHWEALVDQSLKGPPGCWDLEGTLSINGHMISPATGFSRSGKSALGGDGRWQGRIEDGRWQRFAYDQTVPEGAMALSAPILPLIGVIDQSVVERPPPVEGKRDTVTITMDDEEGGDGSAEALNLMRGLIDAWDPNTATAVSEWREDQAAIELVQDFPIDKSPRSPVTVVTSTFPGGTDALTRMDAEFPKRIKMGSWPMVATLTDMQFHLRQQQVGKTVLPAVESFSVTVSFMGFTLAYEQRIAYATASPCTSSVE